MMSTLDDNPSIKPSFHIFVGSNRIVMRYHYNLLQYNEHSS